MGRANARGPATPFTLIRPPYPFSLPAMKIGYARVSTDEQVVDLQTDALAGAGCEAVYVEHASGKTAVRPELESCLKALRAGDTLVVWRLDRLGRDLRDLVNVVS